MMTPLADLEYQSIRLRPAWASNGIIDARAFRIGESAVIHALTHASPNLVRGKCGVVAHVVERDGRLASWADGDVNCESCTGERFRIPARLRYLRSQIHAQCISYGEIAELQSLADHIADGDVELLEWANVSEENALRDGRI